MKNCIEALRKAESLTQQALAAELGVSRQTVISLESGRYSPSLGLAHAIAKLFGKRIEEIFLFEEEES
ncbi:MAG: helix-turn-helix transcriptional regulator [Oscillospiraceae bacterium]|nr:helix-turn-helix transcriptional regulator [Oscillospiraceae bacterium]